AGARLDRRPEPQRSPEIEGRDDDCGDHGNVCSTRTPVPLSSRYGRSYWEDGRPADRVLPPPRPSHRLRLRRRGPAPRPARVVGLEPRGGLEAPQLPPLRRDARAHSARDPLRPARLPALPAPAAAPT